MEADFSGYATKANVKCSDGKTIKSSAFQHMDKMQVPLVWQHGHNDVNNVLGHAILEARQDGIYAYGFFNDTTGGQNAKVMVQHKDVKSLSIYANKLSMQGKMVLHGEIREVSLVLAGANPEAKIDYVQVQHGNDVDDIETLADEAIIDMGNDSEFKHAAKMATPVMKNDKPSAPPASSDSSGSDDETDSSDETVQDVFDSLTPKQKNVVSYIVGQALESSGDAQHSDEDDEDEIVNHQEGTGTRMNVFEKANEKQATGSEGGFVRHMVDDADLKSLYELAKSRGSLKAALKEFTVQHGIDNIEALFPDPKLLSNTPDFNSRNMAWVQNVLDGTRKTPFSRIKSLVADITQDEARAKGYITGNYKTEEWFPIVGRTTTPTTVYKKQKLDRDNILDTVDFDIVAWLQGEMRIMLSEEVAIAILLGDGRAMDDPEKIKDPSGSNSGDGIRSIMNDDELYVTRVNVDVDDSNTNWSDIVDQVLAASEFYKGTGGPTFYGTPRTINKMLLSKDGNLHRNYDNLTALAAAMNVSSIVPVEPMNRFPNILGLVVNLTDYNIGTDRGGEVSMFDFFDIDYNQMKYLMETRVTGAMVKLKGAMLLTKAVGTLVEPKAPTFVKSTGVVTIPSQTGVVYKLNGTGSALTAGAQTAMATGTTETIVATPATNYYFAVTGTDLVDNWTFTRPTA